jgi:hypothetical protein
MLSTHRLAYLSALLEDRLQEVFLPIRCIQQCILHLVINIEQVVGVLTSIHHQLIRQWPANINVCSYTFAERHAEVTIYV